jgi:hypothetical protein
MARREREIAIPGSLKDMGPVAKVWAIADMMPQAERKEVLAVCKKLRINPKTAATQYQLERFARTQARRKLPQKVKSELNRVIKVATKEVRAD